jgi:hypothetical protein
MRIQADKSKEGAVFTANTLSKTAGTDAKSLVDNRPVQKKANKTGLPDNLKSGIENLSGQSLDDVKVHHNSAQPAQLNAHAYAQGSNIHIAPGQEKHLPHEAWHVVQQKQGRVKPTLQKKGININDNQALEHEADTMGSKALRDTHQGVQLKTTTTGRNIHQFVYSNMPAGTIQLAKRKKKALGPKALRYGNLSKAKRDKRITKFKSEQTNLFRGRRNHIRHIIPHSDLQAWMQAARKRGGVNTLAGLMRREVYDLLTTFGYAADAALWQNTYTAYEAGPKTNSLLQYNGAVVNSIWKKIEWSKHNVFWGPGGINTAIQNRFDGGNGGLGKSQRLFRIWHSANTVLGLTPTGIQNTRLYSVSLGSYITVKAASHANSRPVQAVLGTVQRTDYRRPVNYKSQL